VPSPTLYLLGASRIVSSSVNFLRRISLLRLAACLSHLNLLSRAVRLLFAAKCVKVCGAVPLLDPVGCEAIQVLRDCDVVYCSGGGNLNDLWLRQELFPRAVIYRLGHALGKPVFVSGQGVGPLKSRLGIWLLKWGAKHVKIFACRDMEESVAQMRSIGVAPEIVQAFGDDATDLRSAGQARGDAILRSEGVLRDGSPLLAVHVRLTNYVTDFRVTGAPFTASLCDSLVEQLNCRIVFIPITHRWERSYDRDIGDAFEVFSHMIHRDRVAFICRATYSPGEMKAIISSCSGLIGYSYHSWVFALTSGRPAFGLFHGEYFRKKSVGLFAWYNHLDWIWDINQTSVEHMVTTISAALQTSSDHKERLDDITRSLLRRVERPVLSAADLQACKKQEVQGHS